MITITNRDREILVAGLFKVPVLPRSALALLWPGNRSGRRNMHRRLHQLCEAGLLRRFGSYTTLVTDVDILCRWKPGQMVPNFGALGWKLQRRWQQLEPTRVIFYAATERAGDYWGGSIRHAVKSAGSLAHDFGLAALYFRFLERYPLLAQAWVAEDTIAASRGHGEKVVDSVIVNSDSVAALAVEFAGASYAASNGARLREIHADCANRRLPYEIWTVAERNCHECGRFGRA